MLVSGYDSVGRVVASNNRCPQFDPVIGKIYIEHFFTVNCIEKTKIKKNRPGMALFNKEILSLIIILEKYGINIVSEML